MLFFLDFDRTLFETERFSRALVRAFIIPGNTFPISDIKNFLYSDSLSFLDERQRAGDVLILVTRGDLTIQKTKVEASGILAHVKEALYVDASTPKSHMISGYLHTHSVLDTEQIFFIDDTIAELEEVQKECPVVKVIRMRRSSARNSGQEAAHLPEVRDFSELTTFIS